MQRSQFFQKSSLLFLSLFTIVILSISNSSCDSAGKKDYTEPENCYTITREEINTNMLAGGWSVPGNNDYVPYFYFEPQESGSVNAIPSDKDNHLFSARKVTVRPPNMDPPCKFPDGLKISLSQYDFSRQGFAENGRLIPFDYLRLIPRASTEPGYEGYMVFDVYMVTGDVAVLKSYSKPCPPYCPVQ